MLGILILAKFGFIFLRRYFWLKYRAFRNVLRDYKNLL